MICQSHQLWIAYISLSLINYSSINDCHFWLRQRFTLLNLHTTDLTTSSSIFFSIVQCTWELSADRPSQLTSKVHYNVSGYSLTFLRIKLQFAAKHKIKCLALRIRFCQCSKESVLVNEMQRSQRTPSEELAAASVACQLVEQYKCPVLISTP